MKLNLSLNNLFNFRRFAGGKILLNDLIGYSVIFLAVLAACLLIFDLYVFYLYFYGFDFPQDEKKAVLFAKSDHERALKIIDERDKLFSDIAAENKTIFPNPFR